jgi:photosystem II stability/assembly factor-like uncharacterized protein
MKSARHLWRMLSIGSMFSIAAWVSEAGTNIWTAAGPDGAEVFAVQFHPTQPGVVFTSSRHTLYRSTNSGQNWSPVHDKLMNGAVRILFDPTNPNRVFAVDGSLYRSDDAGQTFTVTGSPDSNNNLRTIAIASDGTLYGGTYEGKVFRSTNLGVQWIERGQGLPAVNPPPLTHLVRDLAVDPTNPQVAYASIETAGVYKTTNGGELWTNLAVPGQADPQATTYRVAIDPTAPDHLLVASSSGMHRSINGGSTWTTVIIDRFTWVGFDPKHPARVIATRGIGPVMKSENGGQTWSPVASVNTRTQYDAAFDPLNSGAILLATMEGPYFSADLGATFETRRNGIRGGTVIRFAEAGDVVYASYNTGAAGLYRRDNAGWHALDSASLKAVLPGPLNVESMAVAATDQDRILVATPFDLALSTDRGLTWSRLQTDPALRFFSDIRIDPTNAQIAYVASPEEGVWRTETGGATWQPTALDSGWITTLAIDPADPKVIFAAELGSIIHKSTDGGATWSAYTLPTPGLSVRAITIDPSDSSIVYAAAYGGVHKSTDGGKTWNVVNVSQPPGAVPGSIVLVDPVMTSNLVLIARPNEPGAMRSVDSGATWEALPFPSGGFGVIFSRGILDPQRPNVIIAGVGEYGIYELEVAPDLSISLEDVPAQIGIGSNGQTQLRVKNLGPFAASGVRITFNVPSWMTLQSLAPAQGTCTRTPTTASCSIGVVRADQEVITAVTYSADSTPSTGAVVASVRAHESDSALANNDITRNVASAEMTDTAIALARSAASVEQSGTITFTATVTNHGPNIASSAQAVIRLGAGLSFQRATTPLGTCSEAGGVVTCAVGPLGSGLNKIVEVTAVASQAGVLNVSAEVSGAGVDRVVTNNTATSSVTSTAPAPPPSNSGGGGGGGRLEWLLLAWLAAHILCRASRRQRSSTLRHAHA